MKLAPVPSRKDLTDRECAKLLGACIGGLVGMSTPDDVRRAVRWWAETDEAWIDFEELEAAARRALEESTRDLEPFSEDNTKDIGFRDP